MRNIRIEASACLWWAALLLLLPLRWLIAAVLAGSFHELCHYLSIRCVGGDVKMITLTSAGAIMDTTPLEPGQELICAFAGPLGGFVLLLFARFVPVISLFALVQSVFNLLPVYPLDGGRIVKSVLSMWLPAKDPDRLVKTISILFITGIFITALVPLRRFSPELITMILLMILLPRFFPGKRPCKTDSLALQ